ncbi:outer membrane beta-barrel protein [Vibrio mexicanus]|uniref:outer membrane beta-barrel protein n=1 Tax=Vibrio mexicanus TaxID=1004326 RepID=UPI00063C3F75|nr:outer membrane beta-barrel protein [Vibrio mexicanus]
MKKIISLAVVAALSAPAAYANTVEYFVGGGMGYHNSKAKLSVDGLGSSSETASSAAFHFRGGAYVNENHRFTLTANFAGKDDIYHFDLNPIADWTESGKLSQNEFLASYDYIYPVASNVAVFGGVSAGFINNKLSVSGTDWLGGYSYSESERDLAVGAQIGTQVRLDANWSIDATYRYMGTSYEEKNEGVKLAVDNHSEFTVSLDYRF